MSNGGDVFFRVLGPLRAEVGGVEQALGPPRHRALLAYLLVHQGQTISLSAVVEALWGGTPPDSYRAQVHNAVSALRRRLGTIGASTALVTTAGGYRLDLGHDQLDLAHFKALLMQAAAAGSERVELLREALALWSGPPLVDVEAPFATAVRVRLEEERLAAYEQLAEAVMARGGGSDLIGTLAELVELHPYRERLRGLLMVGLHHSGRREEALRHAADLRRLLRDELGLDPCDEVVRIQQAILAGGDVVTPWASAREPRSIPAQLPADVDAFVGREHDVDLLSTGLEGRIIVVTGPGGVGKTALVTRGAHQAAARFPDGQLYADLQGASPGKRPLSSTDVLRRFLLGLGVDRDRLPTDPHEAAAQFRSLLAGRRTLVVLDNAADSAQVRPLLPGAASCATLVTSRRVLADIDGAVHHHLGVLTPAESISMLADTVSRARVSADIEAAGRIAELCGQLPLALRLAGARLVARPGWSLAEMAARLEDHQHRLDELRYGDRAVRSAFEVAYRAIGASRRPIERAAADAFRLLGAIDGPDIGIGAASRLLDLPEQRAAEVLAVLVDVRLADEPHSGRYTMHDLVRLFARELAEADPAVDSALRRAWTFYLGTCAATRLQFGRPGEIPLVPRAMTLDSLSMPSRQAAHDWCDLERPNLRAALKQAAAWADADGQMFAPWLATAMNRYEILNGRWRDTLEDLETATTAARSVGDDRAELKMLELRAQILTKLNDLPAAIELGDEEVAWWRRLGDRVGEARALCNLGLRHSMRHEFDISNRYLTRSERLCRELGEDYGLAVNLVNLGDNLILTDRPAKALAPLEEAMTTFVAHREIWHAAFASSSLALARILSGDQSQDAFALFDQALAWAEEVRSPACQTQVHCQRSQAERFAGQADRALGSAQRAVQVATDVDSQRIQGLARWRAGEALLDLGHPQAANNQLRQALVALDNAGAVEARHVRALLDRNHAG